LAGWLPLLGPALGGLLAGIEANNSNGQQNPQDEFTRDWARGLLNSPKPALTPVTNQYRDKMMGLLGGGQASSQLPLTPVTNQYRDKMMGLLGSGQVPDQLKSWRPY
jgi:hypothetical protein